MNCGQGESLVYDIFMYGVVLQKPNRITRMKENLTLELLVASLLDTQKDQKDSDFIVHHIP